MAITSLDGLITALCATSAQSFVLQKSFTNQAAGAWHSLWTMAGQPGAAANPSSGVGGDVPTSSTAGAYPFTNPTSPALTYLARLSASLTGQGTLILYDRLWQNSGLSATSLTAQTVSSVALTRPDANGAQAEAWFQVYAVMGAGSTAPTISYTDQSGNTGNTGTLQGFATTAAAGRTFPFSLAAGDTGVRAIATYTNGATMTSGTFGLVIRRRLAAVITTASNSGALVDPLTGGLPTIPDNACLEFVYQGGTVTNVAYGGFTLAQG